MIITHEGHKIIRDPVEKLYTKISSHEPQVRGCVQQFCWRLDQARDSGKPLNLSHACLSLAIGTAIHAQCAMDIRRCILTVYSLKMSQQLPLSKLLQTIWKNLVSMRNCQLT